MSITPFKTIGALAWPSQKTGRAGWSLTLDVCADEAKPNDMQFRVSGSFQSSDVLLLVGWGKKQKATDWFSDVIDKRAMSVMAWHHCVLPISPAPYIEAKDATALYLQILHQCLGAEKLLYVGDSPIGRDAKEQIVDLKGDKDNRIQDYPAAAALCYAVSAAYLWYRAPVRERIPTHAEHIINTVEGKLEYESYSNKYLDLEGEVSGDDGIW